MAGPLEGIRVLDLTRNVAGPYATKLLADYGADVLKLEPPEGDPARRFGPFPGNVEDLEASGLFLHLNTNKRSATVDPSTAEGAATIRRLAAECDVLIEDYEAGRAAGPVGYDDLIDLWGIGPYAASHVAVLQHDFSRIPVDSEVTSYCRERYGIGPKEIDAHFEPWGDFRFLGYRLTKNALRDRGE